MHTVFPQQLAILDEVQCILLYAFIAINIDCKHVPKHSIAKQGKIFSEYNFPNYQEYRTQWNEKKKTLHKLIVGAVHIAIFITRTFTTDVEHNNRYIIRAATTRKQHKKKKTNIEHKLKWTEWMCLCIRCSISDILVAQWTIVSVSKINEIWICCVSDAKNNY